MGLLDKIRQEAEAPTVRVPPREDELAPTTKDGEKSATAPDAAMSMPANSNAGIDYWEEQLAKYPVVADRKVGVRMEEEILEGMQQLCRENDITIETLLESFYVNCKGNESLMRRVVKEAQYRIQRRTEAGNIRSLITKSKNLRNKG